MSVVVEPEIEPALELLPVAELETRLRLVAEERGRVCAEGDRLRVEMEKILRALQYARQREAQNDGEKS